MLRINNLKCSYNDVIQALSGVTLAVGRGQIVGLLGPNGAGKTSILRCIMGEMRFLNGKIAGGEISFEDKSLGDSPPFEVTRSGISLVPEDRQLFVDMTVDENLLMGAYTVKNRRIVEENRQRAFVYFPTLKPLRHRLAGYLSGGEQQMLAIARALMPNPKLLLLDEPSTGLAPMVVKDIFRIIKKIRDENMTSILLVEQNAKMTFWISDACFILESGVTVLHGESKLLRDDPRVKDIYLGVS